MRCVPSHAGGNRYQVEYGPSNQHVVAPTRIGISLASLYTKQTQLTIYSNFIRPVRGPKQWESVSDMLPILLPTLRRPLGRPTKVKRHKVGVHNQVVAPTHQEVIAPKEKLSFKRKPTIVR
ncbi:hypothetical protein GOBAR_AA09114 [Gossypium barbadense]|uniref:Uncharacterized protein n=1 Tax=Gossypium barbadense TaxID=3634 RepID=A0A2P5Y7F0_GOSBA|nr:hypothetical protein GOBAR_AA09114 [Gossypium barbadense]